jgi:hypothetical protein
MNNQLFCQISWPIHFSIINQISSGQRKSANSFIKSENLMQTSPFKSKWRVQEQQYLSKFLFGKVQNLMSVHEQHYNNIDYLLPRELYDGVEALEESVKL